MPALVGTLGHDGPLGGKSGQVLPCARLLQPDGLGDLAGRGLGRVGQVLQNFRFALLGNAAGLSPLFYRHFFRDQRRQQRGTVGTETLGDLRRFPALLLPDVPGAQVVHPLPVTAAGVQVQHFRRMYPPKVLAKAE